MICNYCNKEFEGRKNKLYCSKSCKNKAYAKSFNGMLIGSYKHMIERSKNKGVSDYLISFEEFKQIANSSENLNNLYNQWRDSNFTYKLRPSVDRIDHKKGYTKDNIQFLTISENISKGNQEVNYNVRYKNNTWKANSIKVKMYNKNKVLFFDSYTEASNYFNVNKGTISYAIKNNKKIQGYSIERGLSTN